MFFIILDYITSPFSIFFLSSFLDAFYFVFLTDFDAVSYTHLDVYKRQVDGEIKLFKVGRNYKELVGRLGIERVENIEILPCVKADIAAVDDDVVNDEFITYLVVTDYTKGDMTILDRDQLYDKMIWNNPINYNDIVENYEKLNNHYVDNNNIRYLIKNDVCRPKIRLLLDDGG